MFTLEKILIALTPSEYEQIFLVLYAAFTIYCLSRMRGMPLKALFGTTYVRAQVSMMMTPRYLLIMGVIYLALAFFNWNLSLAIGLALTLLYVILALVKIGPSAFSPLSKGDMD